MKKRARFTTMPAGKPLSAVPLSAMTLAAVALAACTGGNPANDVNPNIFPTDYKKEIVLTMPTIVDDATNIREAGVSEPALRTIGTEQRYAVCVRYNSRNMVREYAGMRMSIAYFFGGKLNQLVAATPEQCGKADYKPFPELEKVCYATACN